MNMELVSEAPFLETEDIHKSFNHVQALKGVSMKAYGGEVLAIVGDKMAVEIALHCGSTKDVVKELAERIGSGPAISETVPTALGILIANQGDTMESIYDAVNIGDETSAIACIVGAIAGACNGADSIPEGYLGIIEKENHMDLTAQAEGIEALW